MRALRPVSWKRGWLVPAAAALVFAWGAGCGGDERQVTILDEGLCPVYDDSTAALPRLLYADRTRTLNDRCMVRSSRLNPRIRAIYVNGRPVGFC